jgi:hypothetical protein
MFWELRCLVCKRYKKVTAFVFTRAAKRSVFISFRLETVLKLLRAYGKSDATANSEFSAPFSNRSGLGVNVVLIFFACQVTHA